LVVLVTYSKKLEGISDQTVKVNIWTWVAERLRCPEKKLIFSQSVLFDIIMVIKRDVMGWACRIHEMEVIYISIEFHSTS
jgi:hypothetical protein